jgi:tetratricopeptide (TPR) repeat protein
MDNNRPTIIDFVEKYSHQFAKNVYIREKVDGNWKEITQEQTREEAYRIGAGLMALGVEKGDKVALLSESRAMWVLAELGAMYAGATDVPLSVNLGEGKLDNVPDNRAYYMMGRAYRMMGDEARAVECFVKAAAGSPGPEPVRYYNDQPSDYIYYQGLAFAALGDMEKAKKSFHQLIIFGEQHLFDKVGYDFFAVSMPELEVYQDDIQKRSDDYCRRLMELGRRGLEEIRQ